MGIDLSKAKPGIAIINLNQKKVVYLDDFEDKTKNDNVERYLEIKYWLKDMIEYFRPEAVMIEKEFIKPGFGSKATIPLLKLHGYVYMVIKEYGLNMYEILPSSSRAFLKIKPNSKQGAFDFIKKEFPDLGFKNFKKENDKADAIIIALNFFNNKKVEL